jgi:hypothetical protein
MGKLLFKVVDKDQVVQAAFSYENAGHAARMADKIKGRVMRGGMIVWRGDLALPPMPFLDDLSIRDVMDEAWQSR